MTPETMEVDKQIVFDQLSMVGLSSDEEMRGLMRMRMETVRRLSEGCFHQMRSDLSVLIGHLDLANEAGNSGTNLESDTFLSSVRIGRIANELAGRLENLAEFQRIASGTAKEISCQEASDRLSDMFSGMSQWTRDSRGVSIEIVSGPHRGADFPIGSQLLIDYVFPFLIETMSEAVSSGSIGVRAINREKTQLMQIEFGCAIVSHIDLQQALTNSCRYTADVRNGQLFSHQGSSTVVGKYYRKKSGECVVEFHHQ